MMRSGLLMALALGLASNVYSIENSKGGDRSISKTTAGVSWAKRVKQGFSMQVWLSNQIAMGIEAWGDAGTDVPVEDCGVGIGLEYPAGAGTCIEHLFGAGPMIGGLVNGKRRVSQSYAESGNQHFAPLRKDTLRDKIWYTSVNDDPFLDFNFNPAKKLTQRVNRKNCDDDGDGRIDEDELDGLDNDGDWNPLTDDLGADGLPDSLEAGCDGKAYNSVTNPDPAEDNYETQVRDKCRPDPNTGALPFKRDKNRYTQGNGIPDHGEPHVDEDFGAVSDRDYYMGSTDTVTGVPGVPASHVPMGVKIFMKTYAWRGIFADGIIPIDYYFVNVGRNIIKDVYIGFNDDEDVGPVSVSTYPQNNYACYIPELRTAYIHNAKDRGSTPLGITVLGTPRPLPQLQYVFQWYDIGDLGEVDSVVYSWLNGERFGTQLIKTCKPPETPADCRIFFSFGPFNGADGNGFKPGDTLKISMALVGGDGVEGTEHSLRANAEKALRLFSSGFQSPAIPPSPKLVATPGFKKVTLNWFPHQAALGSEGPYDTWDDSNKIAESYPDTSWRRKNPPCVTGIAACQSGGHVCANGTLPGGRILEGFRLYRSEDPGNNTPNAKNFTLLKQYDFTDDAYEFNVGIESTFVDTNLVRGKRYWYSVTSFGIPNRTVNTTPHTDTLGSTTYTYDTLITPGSESSISENALDGKVDLPFSVAQKAGEVLVVPNPYRVDHDYTFESGGWEGRTNVWTENQRLVKFIHLPVKCTIRIFTLAGDEIAVLEHDDPVRGELQWNLVSKSNRALASGVYIFTVESDLGKQVGKFVLAR